VFDRPSDRTSELIAVQTVVAPESAVFLLFEKADRIELVIAHEIENVSMEAVRSRLCHCVHGCTR
jgi:hypothetical protein